MTYHEAVKKFAAEFLQENNRKHNHYQGDATFRAVHVPVADCVDWDRVETFDFRIDGSAGGGCPTCGDYGSVNISLVVPWNCESNRTTFEVHLADLYDIQDGFDLGALIRKLVEG